VSSSSSSETQDDVVEIRADIARMREEAIRRLDVLNQKFQQEVEDKQQLTEDDGDDVQSFVDIIFGSQEDDDKNNNELSTSDSRLKGLVGLADSFDREVQIPIVADSISTTTATTKDIEVSSSLQQKQQTRKQSKHPLKLLDGTRWRLMLNIGREPGTFLLAFSKGRSTII
jgi:hypothetical protein